MTGRPLLRPNRIRRVERPFGWVPFWVLKSGLLGQLSVPAKLLYFFLCLVADSQGISFWGHGRVMEVLALSRSQLVSAIDELCTHDLLAFDGKVFQLLSRPHRRIAEVNNATS